MSGDHNAHQSDFHPDLEIDSLILKDFGERYAADTALLRQALDAMLNVLSGGEYDNPFADLKAAAAAIKERLK